MDKEGYNSRCNDHVGVSPIHLHLLIHLFDSLLVDCFFDFKGMCERVRTACALYTTFLSPAQQAFFNCDQLNDDGTPKFSTNEADCYVLDNEVDRCVDRNHTGILLSFIFVCLFLFIYLFIFKFINFVIIFFQLLILSYSTKCTCEIRLSVV